MTSQLVRKFSSTASLYQHVPMPLQVFGVHGRYASALYTAGVKLKKLDSIEKDSSTLSKVLKTDNRFREFLKDPTLRKQDKVAIMNKVLAKLKISEPMLKFMDVLGRNGRLNIAETVFNSIGMILDAHKGIVKCEVTSAKPLDDATMRELNTVLELFLSKGQKIDVLKKVDPDLIGGLTVSIGDKFVDMSVAKKIRTYREAMEKAL